MQRRGDDQGSAPRSFGSGRKEPPRRTTAAPSARGSLRDSQLRKVGADLVEGGDDLVRRRQEKEFARVGIDARAACTVLQQLGRWAVVRVDLNRIERDAG